MQLMAHNTINVLKASGLYTLNCQNDEFYDMWILL
jgi:hypothetical protein